MANCTWSRLWVPGGPHDGLEPFVLWFFSQVSGPGMLGTLGKLITQGERGWPKAGLWSPPRSWCHAGASAVFGDKASQVLCKIGYRSDETLTLSVLSEAQ